MFQNMFYLLLLSGIIGIISPGNVDDMSDVRRIFADQMINMFGDGKEITANDVKLLYEKHMLQWLEQGTQSKCFNKDGMATSTESCLLEKCLTPAEVYQLSGLSNGMSSINISTLSMIILHTLENGTCEVQGPIALRHTQVEHDEDDHDHVPVSKAEIWGYGILCTTVIVLAALGGLLALPFVQGANYKRLLIYMIGLAVGTLSGSSILFLIPEALEMHEEDLGEHNPLWKFLVVIAAIYTFFLVERILKMITSWRERHKHQKELHDEIMGGRFASLKPETKLRDPKFTDLKTVSQISQSGEHVSKDSGLDNASQHETVNEFNMQPNGAPAVSGTEVERDINEVAPVAWMIIFGDALHNFVDGVSIGAAFTISVLGGVSVSVAVFCEELPHELGDFAVLINAGMSKKRAALFNFLSACTIYIGLVVGILLGENLEADTWIFSFAGGMFLYIALVDMMPEMCAAGELEDNKKVVGTGVIFLLQNLGLLSGFGVILILAIYGGNLQTAITGTE